MVHPGIAPRAAAPSCASALLSVRDICVRFGGINALDGVSFDVHAGEILGLIGPNGAGKTTLFNCLSRLCTPDQGDILLDGRSIMALPQHAIPGLGIGRTFQNAALFDRMSVLDNIKVGCHARTRSGFLTNMLRLPARQVDESRIGQRADELLVLMSLEPYAHRPAGELPFPVKKRLELARALAGSPQLLLLDEPAAGLNLDEVEALRGQIRHIRDAHGVAVLLVEHHMGLVMSVCDRVVALDLGRSIAGGTPAEIQQDPAVIRAYLGTGA